MPHLGKHNCSPKQKAFRTRNTIAVTKQSARFLSKRQEPMTKSCYQEQIEEKITLAQTCKPRQYQFR